MTHFLTLDVCAYIALFFFVVVLPWLIVTVNLRQNIRQAGFSSDDDILALSRALITRYRHLD